MDENQFDYKVEELDGVRLIRVRFPKAITLSELPAAYSRYLALWDVEAPTVVIADVRALVAMPPEAIKAITVLRQRIRVTEGFVASAWLTSRESPVFETIRGLSSEAIEDGAPILEDEATAIDYLRAQIAAWRGDSRGGPG